jgi:hypothetical protein
MSNIGVAVGVIAHESVTLPLLLLGTVGLVLRTRWHPLWLIAAGALVGLAGLV